MGKEDRVCHKIIDVAVPADCRVNAKGAMRKVEVILVVVGALQFGGNLNRSRQHAEKTALLGTARMAVLTLGTDYPSQRLVIPWIIRVRHIIRLTLKKEWS